MRADSSTPKRIDLCIASIADFARPGGSSGIARRVSTPKVDTCKLPLLKENPIIKNRLQVQGRPSEEERYP